MDLHDPHFITFVYYKMGLRDPHFIYFCRLLYKMDLLDPHFIYFCLLLSTFLDLVFFLLSPRLPGT